MMRIKEKLKVFDFYITSREKVGQGPVAYLSIKSIYFDMMWFSLGMSQISMFANRNIQFNPKSATAI